MTTLKGLLGRNAQLNTRLVGPDASPSWFPVSHMNTLAKTPPRPAPHATMRWPSSDHARSSTAPESGRCSALSANVSS